MFVYGVSFAHLFPAFDSWWGLVIVKTKQIDVSLLYVSVPLLFTDFFMTMLNQIMKRFDINKRKAA